MIMYTDISSDRAEGATGLGCYLPNLIVLFDVERDVDTDVF